MFLSNKNYVKILVAIVAAVSVMTYLELKKFNDKNFFIFPTILHISEGQHFPKNSPSLHVDEIISTSTQQTRSLARTSKPSTTSTTREFLRTPSEKKEATSCSDWEFPAKVEEVKHPQINLDPNRFLYPGLIWGPNNQIIGLRNAIYLAIRLNRTLVVPKFFAQYTHSGELSPYQAIDVQRLCSFVTCMSIEKFRDRCNASFDVVFEGRASKYYYIKKNEAATKMNLLRPNKLRGGVPHARNLTFTDSKETSPIPTLPSIDDLSRFGHVIPGDQSTLRSIFNTTAPCAIYASVYNSIVVHLLNNSLLPMTSLNKSLSDISNDALYSTIADAVRHPPCIVKAANKYIRDVLGDRSYVALHWRYDTADWVRLACRKPTPVWSRFLCANLNKIKPLHIARAISRAVGSSDKTLNSTQDSVPVYIATPPTLKSFVDEIYDELRLIDNRYAKPSSTLDVYMKDKYASCFDEHRWKNVEEILSLTEMELMINSSWFFFSPGSTWSSNVLPYRVKLDGKKTITELHRADAFQLALSEEEKVRKKSESE